MHERRDAGEVVIVDVVAGSAELGDDAGDVDGVPNQDGIGQQAESPSKIMFSFGRAFVASAGLTPSGGMPARCG